MLQLLINYLERGRSMPAIVPWYRVRCAAWPSSTEASTANTPLASGTLPIFVLASRRLPGLLARHPSDPPTLMWSAYAM